MPSADGTAAEFAESLTSMTDEEVFATMQELEALSEEQATRGGDVLEDLRYRLAITEEEIGRRYPGQLLQPYLDWQRRDYTRL